MILHINIFDIIKKAALWYLILASGLVMSVASSPVLFCSLLGIMALELLGEIGLINSVIQIGLTVYLAFLFPPLAMPIMAMLICSVILKLCLPIESSRIFAVLGAMTQLVSAGLLVSSTLLLPTTPIVFALYFLIALNACNILGGFIGGATFSGRMPPDQSAPFDGSFNSHSRYTTDSALRFYPSQDQGNSYPAIRSRATR